MIFLKSERSWKKNIVLFLTSQTISLFGSSLVQYAITWYITLKTQSGIMMTISIICGVLPIFFLSPFAGVWADRYNRKTLIMLADSMIALCTLILAILFLAGYQMMWLLFFMSAIRALGTAVQGPAVGAFIPQLVPEDKLIKVNGLNSSIQSAVMLVSPMLSGALLTFTTIELIFFIDVFTAIIGVSVLMFFLHVPAHAKAQEVQKVSYFTDLGEGIKYIRKQAFLKKFFLFCAIFMVMAAPAAFLTPLQVTRTFGEDVWRLTAIEMTFSIGMMAGGILMALWGGFKNKIHSMTLGTLLFGACTIALGVVPIFWLYLVFMVIVGLAMPIFNTPATVMLQEKVEADYLGRTFSVLSMISSTMMPLGMLIFGPIADIIAIENLLILTGVIMCLESLFLLRSKELLEAGKPSEQSA